MFILREGQNRTMTYILNKRLFRILFILTCSTLISLQTFSYSVNAGEYDHFKQNPVEDTELLREAREWFLRGEALGRRIDKLIHDWHNVRNKDLERESVCLALEDIDDFIRKNDELLSQAQSNCRDAEFGEAFCPLAARYKEGKKQLIEQIKKLESMLEEKSYDCK